MSSIIENATDAQIDRISDMVILLTRMMVPVDASILTGRSARLIQELVNHCAKNSGESPHPPGLIPDRCFSCARSVIYRVKAETAIDAEVIRLWNFLPDECTPKDRLEFLQGNGIY